MESSSGIFYTLPQINLKQSLMNYIIPPCAPPFPICSSSNINCDSLDKNRKEMYGHGSEAKNISEKLGNFQIDNSFAYHFIKTKFGRSLRFNELIGIVKSIQAYCSQKGIVLPPITRNEKRSFQLLIKYVDDHFEILRPILEKVTLCDESFNPIPLDIDSH